MSAHFAYNYHEISKVKEFFEKKKTKKTGFWGKLVPITFNLVYIEKRAALFCFQAFMLC